MLTVPPGRAVSSTAKSATECRTNGTWRGRLRTGRPGTHSFEVGSGELGLLSTTLVVQVEKSARCVCLCADNNF